MFFLKNGRKMFEKLVGGLTPFHLVDPFEFVYINDSSWRHRNRIVST